MKNMFLTIIIVMVCWAPMAAQQQVITGTVEIDGYSKITKGAFWGSRPEAKMVYYGQYPKGIEVIILETNHFVRFVKGENNRFDINYIVFPEGEKIYIKNGEYFAAICGNKISFIQPVNKVEIREVEKIVEVEKPIYLSPQSIISSPVQDQWKIEPEKEVIVPEFVKRKSWFQRNWKWVAPLVSIGAGLTIYELFSKDKQVVIETPTGTMSGGRGDNNPNPNTGTGTMSGGRGDNNPNPNTGTGTQDGGRGD